MQKRMLIAFSILLIAVIIGIAFYKTKFTFENFAGAGSASSTSGGTLTYYYSPTCGYCQKFSPTWDGDSSDSTSLQYALNQSGLTTALNKVDISDPANATLATSKKIQGVPTLIYTTPGGKDVEYTDDRTPANIVAFLKNNASK
uniref:Thioredoxin domain-containing protein n=1 Tax=viral metagenome TaxID=1070528 RepID=A0A6C0KVB2_9ZZZZ